LRARVVRWSFLIISGFLAVVVFAPTHPAMSAKADAGSATSGLRLITPSASVVNYRYPDYGTLLDLGAYVVTQGSTFEMRLKRASYDQQIVATARFRAGRNAKVTVLPEDMLQDFTGLPDFLRIVMTDANGTKVLDVTRPFCPANKAVRIKPNADRKSPYPQKCSLHPFTLGSVWGIPAGWGAPTRSIANGPVDLPVGTYTAEISVTEQYRRLFAMPDQHRTVTVTVRDAEGRMPPPARIHDEDPEAARPAGLPYAPSAGLASAPRAARPDLRALPAWGLFLINNHAPEPTGPRDNLIFAATAWNAGPAPLVVNGFRRPGTDLLDSYQSFIDAAGRTVGHARVGTMEWDSRPGHQHWHFTDFATYRLLNADRTLVVRSQKEAFCLANTDPIDYTVRNANWQPDHDSLSTSCGIANSRFVRQVLHVGNGDTYVQEKPGQSFDVTDLPNGTYFIQVIANPNRALYETNTDNNESLRQFTLTGIPGKRTLIVPPVGLIPS
jgi:hypothetical protein